MKLILEKRERVIVKTRSHVRALRGPLLRFFLLLAATSFLTGLLIRTDLPDWAAEAGPLLLALLGVAFCVLFVIWCLRPLARWAGTWTYLTTERIVVKRGRSAAGQRSVGLYAVQDIVALTGRRAPYDAPGTLQIALAEERINIPHVPAVQKMRGLCIVAIAALPRFPRVDGVNMEERVEQDQSTHQQQRDWTEHE